jgi:HD-like signal output (HDOD) protein
VHHATPPTASASLLRPTLSGIPAVPAAPQRSVRPEDVVRQILEADDFPAFSHQMVELTASLDGGDASAQRLANLVLRDYALTVKVIRTANTVHYNRTGRPVQSATHAMMLLGASTVRDLASGLLLFEQYRKRSPGLKELMLLSMLTAGHAREAAMRMGLDPETAQLCGMFRNLGEVLVAAHLPREYAAVLLQTARRRQAGDTRPRSQAAESILGCSFEDVGTAIAGDWGMPEGVFLGMRATGGPKEKGYELITAFGHDLTNAIYREEPTTARGAIDTVLKSYGGRLQMNKDVLAAVADSALGATRDTFSTAHVALDDLRLARQIGNALTDEREVRSARTARPAGGTQDATVAEAAIAGVGDASASADVSAASASACTPAIPGDESGVEPCPATVEPIGAAPDAPPDAPPVSGPALAALRDRLALELEAAAADVDVHDLQRTLLIALEAALRGGPFDRAAFCVPDPRVTHLSARYALGENAEQLLAQPQLSLAASSGPLGTALLRGESVLLAHGAMRGSLEGHLLRSWGATSAALWPVSIDGVTIGCLYADRQQSPPAIDAAANGYALRLVAALTDAVVQRRAAAARGAAAAPVPPAPKAQPQNAQDKAAVVLRLLRGESIASVAAELGVSEADLTRWRAEFLDGAVSRLGES